MGKYLQKCFSRMRKMYSAIAETQIQLHFFIREFNYIVVVKLFKSNIFFPTLNPFSDGLSYYFFNLSLVLIYKSVRRERTHLNITRGFANQVLGKKWYNIKLEFHSYYHPDGTTSISQQNFCGLYSLLSCNHLV